MGRARSIDGICSATKCIEDVVSGVSVVVHRDVSHQRTGDRRPQEEQKGEDDEEEELIGTLWRLLNRKITDLCDKSSPLLAY